MGSTVYPFFSLSNWISLRHFPSTIMQHLWWVISSYQAFLMTWEGHHFFLFCKVSNCALAALQSERTVNVLGVTSLWTTSVLISAWDWYDVHMLTDWIPSGPIWLKNMFLTDDETALELLKWFVPWSFKKKKRGWILLFWRWLLFRSSVSDFVECTGFICAHWGYKK